MTQNPKFNSLIVDALMQRGSPALPPLPSIPAPPRTMVAQSSGLPPLPSSPPPIPKRRPPTVYSQAVQQFPILDTLGLEVTESPGKSGAYLEFWPADEPGAADFPRPKSLPMGKVGLELYRNDLRPIDIMGDVASHHMVKSDPVVKRTYEAFERSLEPWQEQQLRQQYDYAKKNEGERRSFADWKERSGLPAYFRGYAFQQWGAEAPQFYTPQQLQMFDAMMGYLSRGRK